MQNGRISNQLARHKRTLEIRDDPRKKLLKMVSQDFGEDLVQHITKSDGSKVFEFFRSCHLWNEHYHRITKAIRDGFTFQEIMNILTYILLQEFPMSPVEQRRKTVRAQRLGRSHLEQHSLDLYICVLLAQCIVHIRGNFIRNSIQDISLITRFG